MPANGQRLVRARTIEYSSGALQPEHVHDEHQLVYASRGLLCVDTESARWVVPPLRAVWIPARLPHAILSKSDSEMLALYIDASVSDRRLEAATVLSVSPLLRELITHIARASNGDPTQRIYEDALIDQLSAAANAPLQLPRLRSPMLLAIERALESNPRDQRTLAEFGRSVGAHERTLQRLFRQEIDTTFGRWRTQLRLRHGVIALGQGNNVTTAASISGYREPSAFIAAFRSAFGTTPGTYFDR